MVKVNEKPTYEELEQELRTVKELLFALVWREPHHRMYIAAKDVLEVPYSQAMNLELRLHFGTEVASKHFELVARMPDSITFTPEGELCAVFPSVFIQS